MARPSLNDQERAVRRRQLLDAAWLLYSQTRELPTVAQIAEHAGVAKGTVYLSFRTKEQIFIALLQDRIGGLFAQVLPALFVLPTTAAEAAESFASAYAAQFHLQPELMSLAAMTQSVLEKNMPLEPLVKFKERVYTSLARAGEMLDQRIPGLQPGNGEDLLLRTWALTVGLWQSMDCPSPLYKFLQAHPSHPLAERLLERRFDQELHSAVLFLWRGSMGVGRADLPPKAGAAAQAIAAGRAPA